MGADSDHPSSESTRRSASCSRRVMVLHIACLIALSLLLTWPVLIHGIPDLSHDGYHHARWARQFGTQFWQGEWYPRWFTNVNGGFGGPSGFFYPPLTNYLASVFWPLVAMRESGAWLAAGYVVVLGEILSAITAYLWLLSFGSAGAALLGSVLYIVAPYHLAIDVYMRGASAEFWAFVWFPLILLCTQKLMQHSKWAIAGMATSLGLAFLSQPVMALCFAPIPLSYVYFCSEHQDRRRNAALMVVAMLLAVGLSAAYLLPAKLDQSKANAESYLTGHYDYRQWLIGDREQLTAMTRYFLGGKAPDTTDSNWYFLLKVRMLVVTLSSLLVIAALFVVYRRCNTVSPRRKIAAFWVSVAFVCLFLMTSLSSFLWKLVPVLRFLQFPFRLNAMLIVCAAALVPMAYHHLLQPRARLLSGLLGLLLAAWLVADIYSSRWNFSNWGVGNPGRAAMYRPLWRTQIDPQEMWPRPGNDQALSDMAAFDWFAASHPPQAAQLQAASRRSSGTAQVERWQPRRVVLKVDALSDTVLVVNHFYYSGWQAHIEGTNRHLTVHPSGDGLIEVDVPPGSYNLLLELPRMGAERAGVWISLLSLLLIAGTPAWTLLPGLTGNMRARNRHTSMIGPSPLHN